MFHVLGVNDGHQKTNFPYLCNSPKGRVLSSEWLIHLFICETEQDVNLSDVNK